MERPLGWAERARRVREGDTALADAAVALPAAEYHALFDTILRQSFDSVVLCSRLTGEYFAVSDSFCRLTGYSPAELLGRTSVDLGMVDPEGTRRYAEQDTVERRPGIYENTLTRKDGAQRVVEFSHQFVGDDYTIVIIRDITQRREQEFELLRQATADPLTGLLNRRGFTDQAAAVLRDAADAGRVVHLVMADLDALKRINDRYGHPAGDQSLRRVGQELRRHVSGPALVARLGGDEFAVLVDGATGAEVSALCTRIGAALAAPPAETDPPLALSLSIGTASTADGHDSLDALMAAADQHLYAVKRRR